MVDVLTDLEINNQLIFFTTCPEALDYLLTTKDKPFIIISDINLPGMKGLELKQRINESRYLKRKSIPFIFLSTTGNLAEVNQAYDLIAQGYFVKQDSFERYRGMMQMIIDYWKSAKHPYN
jgi:CheY-like chemotaxis protein